MLADEITPNQKHELALDRAAREALDAARRKAADWRKLSGASVRRAAAETKQKLARARKIMEQVGPIQVQWMEGYRAGFYRTDSRPWSAGWRAGSRARRLFDAKIVPPTCPTL